VQLATHDNMQIGFCVSHVAGHGLAHVSNTWPSIGQLGVGGPIGGDGGPIGGPIVGNGGIGGPIVGSDEHIGQHLPNGVIGLLHVGLAQRITRQSSRHLLQHSPGPAGIGLGQTGSAHLTALQSTSGGQREQQKPF
jgi:hypothetical protein